MTSFFISYSNTPGGFYGAVSKSLSQSSLEGNLLYKGDVCGTYSLWLIYAWNTCENVHIIQGDLKNLLLKYILPDELFYFAFKSPFMGQQPGHLNHRNGIIFFPEKLYWNREFDLLNANVKPWLFEILICHWLLQHATSPVVI